MITVNVNEDGTIQGYLTAVEYAIKNGISDCMVRRQVQLGVIPSIKIGNINYIKEDTPYPSLKPGRKKAR